MNGWRAGGMRRVHGSGVSCVIRGVSGALAGSSSEVSDGDATLGWPWDSADRVFGPYGTVTYSVTSGLPAGATPNVAANVITISTTTATLLGSYPFTISGTDGTMTHTVPATLVVTAVPTSTSLTSSVNPTVFSQATTLTATVSGANGGTPTGSVTFKDGTITLGTMSLNSGTATLSISTLAVGSHSLTASYGGSASYRASTSPAVAQAVNQASTTTNLTSSNNPTVFGQAPTLTATVSGANGGTPTGNVTFKDGTITLGTVSLNSGTATLSISTLAVGSHSLTASYGGSASYRASTSPAVAQAVNQASTTTNLTSSKNPQRRGMAVTFTATVRAVAPGAGTPTGTVAFFDGTTQIGTGTLSSGRATYQTKALAVGTHSITAKYAGSSNYVLSASVVLSQVIQ